MAKELSAAARIIQSFSKEWSILVADRVLKCKQTDTAAVANRYLINSLSQRSPLVGRVV